MRDRLISLLRQEKNIIPIEDDRTRFSVISDIADYLLANGVIVLPSGGKEALFGAVDALADMVNQFGYSTTFRKKEAVCDGGLSALESEFWALELCGCKTNSNGTIKRETLWNFSMEESAKKALEAEKSLKSVAARK